MHPTLKIIFRIIFYGVVVYILDKFLNTGIAIKGLVFSYSHPLLVFVSVIYGPIVGGIALALGKFLSQMGKGGYDWILILCSFINCAVIGLLTKKAKIRDGFFTRKDILQFNLSLIFSNFHCWWLLYPLLSRLILKADLELAMNTGFLTALGYYISDTVVATLFLALYARSQITKANFYRN